MNAPGDLPGRPRERNPVFYGSYDWHSCVEMHWLLIRLLRTAADSVPAGEIRATLDRQFAPEAVAAEAAYVAGPDSPGRYGWGWALALVHEASALAGPAPAEQPTLTPGAGRPPWLRWPTPSPAASWTGCPRRPTRSATGCIRTPRSRCPGPCRTPATWRRPATRR